MKILSAVLIATTGLLMAQGVAFAADDDPPDHSVAAPATSLSLQSGGYTASDGCHYFQRGETWYSDMCSRLGTGAEGGDTGQVLLANYGDGDLRELGRADFSMPGYTALMLNSAWYRVPSGQPATADNIQARGTTQNGQYIWVDLPKRASVPVGGSGSSGGSTLAANPKVMEAFLGIQANALDKDPCQMSIHGC